MQLTDILDFKYSNQRIDLPRVNTSTKETTLMYLFNKLPSDCKKMVMHPMLVRSNDWDYIYREYKFKIKLFDKNVIVNNLSERNSALDMFTRTIPGIHALRTANTLKGKNCYMAARPFTEPFFAFKRKSPELLMTEFSNLLDFMLTYNEEVMNTKHKIFVINIESWLDKHKNLGPLSNPVELIYYTMRKNVDLLKHLGEITILIMDGYNGYIKFNTKNLTNRSYIKLRNALNKFKTKNAFNQILDDDGMLAANPELKDKPKNKRVKMTVVTLAKSSSNKDSKGGFSDEEEEDKEREKEEAEEKEEDEEYGDDTDDNNDEETDSSEKKSDIDTDKDIADAIKAAYHDNDAELDKLEKSVLSSTEHLTAREKQLIEKQKKLKVDNRTISEIVNTSSASQFDMAMKDVSKSVATLNSNMTKVSFTNFEETYNKNVMEKDMLTIFNDLSKKHPPLYIRKITKADTSTTLDAKYTFAVYLEDNKRRTSVFRFDYPKFIDGKFMYLAGNKKMFVKQLILKPLVKIAPDTVQICTNYNKIFMYREGIDVSPRIDNFIKIIAGNPKYFKVVKGDASKLNKSVKTTIEYDSIATTFVSIELRGRGVTFYFMQDDITKILNDSKVKIKNKALLNRNKVLIVGFQEDKATGELTALTIDPDSQSVSVASFSEDQDLEPNGKEDGKDIIDVFIEQAKTVGLDIQMPKAEIGKRYVYSRCSIMRKRIPTVILLGYFVGLSTVLKDAKIKYKFSSSRPKLTDAQKMKTGIVQFANGYLSFERYPIQNSLLMNSFSRIDTRGYNLEEFDKKAVYVDLFNEMFNQRILAAALDSYYDNMIDGITKELLHDANYPTNIVDLILAGNELLADNSYNSEIDMHMFRVRSNEMTNAILYKIVSTAYSNYKRTAMNKNPIKMSIPTDMLTRELKTSQAVEDYSKLNPITELEKSNAITSRGPSGINVAEAYTQEKRSYHPTMMGVLAMSSSPDGNVGVVRELTFEPKVKGARGNIEVNEDSNKLNDANLFSATELLSPPGVTLDDSIRTAMAYKQSKQIVPVIQSDPVLISNGAEKTLPYRISNDYTIIAKHNGVVENVDTANHIIVVKYSNVPVGEDDHQIIDTAPQIDKNGAGGFFLSSKYKTDLKKGSRFKKDEIIAYNENFFSKHLDGVKFNIGTLAKVACMSNYNTYEDSTIISKKLSEQMSSEIVMQKSVVLNKDANILKMVNSGEAINVGEEIISFEQGNQEDATVNKLLAGVGDNLKDEIKNLTRTSITSKYTGVIEDVKIYCVSDLKDLSPSIKKVVAAYYKKERNKVKYIKEYKIKDPSNMCNLYTANYDKVTATYDKIKGNTITSGVLIEFYIKYFDRMSIGDKLVNYTALKGTVTEIFPDGKEPFSTFRPDEEISTVFPPGGTLARMVPSALLASFVNKLLVELKRKLASMYLGKPYDYSHDFDTRKK